MVSLVSRALSLVLLAAGSLGLNSHVANAANSAPAMIVPGQFSVSDAGAFTYKIPIATPPGTAGIEPALSLDYSSQSGDGTEGWGWILSGIPSIGRCPRTYAQDNAHGGVNYDTNDRFCLEGQRLVAISGTYGANATIYRTELEGFSQIVSYGTAGNGPSYFVVQTKAGQIMEFGNTTDSKILAQGKTTVRAWAVDKVSDTKGNYYTVSYTNDTVNGQAYPIEIDYTGNASAGLTPYNSVQFVYNTSRLYPIPTYQAGSLSKSTVLLTDVKTYTGLASGGSATLVADYRLAYTAPASAAAHYELTSVTQCDAATGGHCLQPTTFGWQGSKDTLTLTGTANGDSQGALIAPGYFQGSGLTDFINPGLGNNCGVYFASQTGFALSTMNANYESWTHSEGMWSSSPYSGPLCKSSGATGQNRPIDINGDGFTDVLLTQSVALNHYQTFQLLNNGTALNQTNYPPGYPQDPSALLVGDFNGDGRTDILIYLGGTLYEEAFSDGLGDFGLGVQFNSSTPTLAIGDFDGDGCSDVMEQGATNQILLSCNPAVPSFTIPNFTTSEVVLGDFNGDGLTDILVAPASGAATLYLSTGTGLAPPITLSGFTDWGKYAIYVGDWNGDGKDDLLLVASGQPGGYGVGTSHKVFLSTGTGFIAGPTIANTNPSDTNVTAAIADWNNDGASDFWLQKPSGDMEELFSYVPEAISTVSNGLGVTTTVTYDRLNKNGTLYQKCSPPGSPNPFYCGTAYPTLSLDGPIDVVSAVSSSNGIGGTYNSTYAYQAAQTDLHGRGFLGFGQVSVTDSQTGLVQTTVYNQAFPYTRMIASQAKVSGSVTVSSTTNTYGQVSLGTGTDGVARYFIELQKTVVLSNDLNGAAMPTVTTAYTYDCDTGSACAGTSPTGYGNTIKIVVSLSDGSSKTVTNTFANDTSNSHWYLGRLLTANAQNIVGSSNVTRQTSYTYDTGGSTSTGLLLSEVVEPETSSDPSLKLETDYTYDAYGNKVEADAKGCVWATNCGTTTRTTKSAYDTTTYHGQFPTSGTNALNQSESWSYVGNTAFGGPTSHTGPNGLTTSWSYDTFGRKMLETRPDGNKTAIGYAYCTTTFCPVLPVGQTLAELPANVQFYTLTTPETSAGAQSGPIAVTFYDGLSRVIATDLEGFDASGTGCTISAPCWIRSATQYDANGRIHQTSRPYFLSGGTPKWTVSTTIDVLGRVTLTTFPDSSTLATSYCGLTTSFTNAKSQIRTKVNNAQGLVAQVYEAATSTCGTSGALTSYVYDAFGDVVTITDPASNIIANNTFDIRGRKTKSIDADMGTWTYVYDGFGELYSQTNAKLQVTTLTYDALGRTLTRTEPNFSSTYTYDTAPGKGIGQPASATTGVGYTRTETYDSLGRPSTLTLTEDGSPRPYTLAYDSNGRVQTVAYPSGFTAKYTYTTLGFLYQISDNSAGTLFWTAKARDAELHLLSQLQGNGVTTTQAFDPNTGLVQSILAGTSNAVSNQTFTFDPLGNLTARSWLNNSGASVAENACYDALNRLTSTLITTGTGCTGSGAVTVAYDALGNITEKSDVCATVNCFVYGAGAAGPHALTSIVGTYNGVTNPTFTYDANGNQLTGPARAAGYTSFNMPAWLDNLAVAGTQWGGFNWGQASWSASAANFAYNTEHQRIQMTTPAATTYYLNERSSGAMEEKVVAAGATTWNDYILADGKLVAERSCTGVAPCSSGVQIDYFVLDHLGSVAVIVSSAGAVQNRLNYDAWGKRRNPDGTPINCTAGTLPPSSVTRGFTGQEMIDGVCLINLNARVYDPSLGRFLSADPTVGDPTIPQELNRYAYVLNNPLSLTDPSGLCFLGCFWDSGIFRDLLAVVAAFTFNYEVLPFLETGYVGVAGLSAEALVFNAGVSGGIAGLVSTGTLKGAALGALEGGLFAEAGNLLQVRAVTSLGIGHTATAFIAHGLIGGLVSEIGGGRFSSGFLAGGLGTLVPNPTGSQSWEATLTGTVEASALGGAGSVIGGGKFENGAVTGAFGYLFNALAHRPNSNSRGLTIEEARAATTQFDDIDTVSIRVEFVWWLNPSGAALTVDNTMRFPSDITCGDFTTCYNGQYIGWFIHEVTHVWQFQNGLSPIWGHIFGGDAVKNGDYLPLKDYDENADWSTYSAEKQADWNKWNYECTTGIISTGCH